ncbi:hypothetical protein CXG81DRAFT_27017 [Caulochytrium protostelioides]|uniref:Restriction endonuclease type IV Mrr domain-containing protein n=1 Tax=Caulochytrium protostelioides TaxID=1555241 RepID=A0A4V1IUE3_9FUNG|nr:hypothetical protein CXG81DRAFT_27017 [Caulochytrium protostelioides]|eukprot:RKP00259.1 hypothetical protein CXG81DRAFT_27017 [Caulochytrium protostelioides]
MLGLGLPCRGAARGLRQAPMWPRVRHVSTVARGTAYETALQAWWAQHHVALTRRGGAGDQGIDLIGVWRPQPDVRATLLLQCKHVARALQPAVVREFEGTLWRAHGARAAHGAHGARAGPPALAPSLPPPPATRPTVGCLVAASGFTREALAYAQTCGMPLLLMHLTAPHIPFATRARGADAADADADRAAVIGAPEPLVVTSITMNLALARLMPELRVHHFRSPTPDAPVARCELWYAGMPLAAPSSPGPSAA